MPSNTAMAACDVCQKKKPLNERRCPHCANERMERERRRIAVRQDCTVCHQFLGDNLFVDGELRFDLVEMEVQQCAGRNFAHRGCMRKYLQKEGRELLQQAADL